MTIATRCKYCRTPNHGSPCTYCGEQLAIAKRWDKPWCNCELCARVTLMTGSKRCDRCWELEGRIKLDPFLALAVMINNGILELELDGRPLTVKVPMGISPQLFLEEVAKGQPLFLRIANLNPEGTNVVQNHTHNRNVGTASAAGAQARQEE
jgi:hypothetical protein